MAIKLPYVSSPGNIRKALDGIISAGVPERVTQDFVKTVLRIPGGSGDQMTSYLKKIGLADTAGIPTHLYSAFRNEKTRPSTAASLLKLGYRELFKHNEYVHKSSEDELKGLIIQTTGAERGAKMVTHIASCFKNLNSYANFDPEMDNLVTETVDEYRDTQTRTSKIQPSLQQNLGLNLGYTINLNLPATSDSAVFNAIFKSLKEHLLASDHE